MSNARTVLIPIPDRDFDVTEVAVPWRLLTRAGHRVTFATENGTSASADPLLLRGVLFGQLGAETEAKEFYREMIASQEFRGPVAWREANATSFDGMILPGGHAPGMRQYLGSEVVQRLVTAFWKLERPVGAICHGVLVLARSIDSTTGKSVIAARKTTCLPKYMEAVAYGLTAWKLGRYYRTYDAYVEDEVCAALDDARTQFVRGPVNLIKRGTLRDDSPAFVVREGRYVSARWPGDAYLFARTFQSMLEDTVARDDSPREGSP